MNLTNTDTSVSPYLFREYIAPKEHGGLFNRKFQYKFEGTHYDCPSRILADLVLAEYQFRYQAQLIEHWIDRVSPSNENGPSDEVDLDETQLAEIREMSQIYADRQRNLYLKEGALPPHNLAKCYWSTRRNNPGWYLDELLVEECVMMGGCCGRDCGCCAKRLPDLPRRGMSGHCSLACACCGRSQGYAVIDSERVASMDAEYKKVLESDNPYFLARIAHAYFSSTNTKVSSVEAVSVDSSSGKQAVSPPPYKRRTSGFRGKFRTKDSLK